MNITGLQYLNDLRAKWGLPRQHGDEFERPVPIRVAMPARRAPNISPRHRTRFSAPADLATVARVWFIEPVGSLVGQRTQAERFRAIREAE